MTYLEKANEVMAQAFGFASVSLGDIIGSVFLQLVTFFLNFLLGA